MLSVTQHRRRATRRNRGVRCSIERLEQKLVLSADASSALFSALTTQRSWIDYAPSYDSASDPYNANPTETRLRADLTTLYQEGWRGLVTYTLLGSYSEIPRIAKSVGFQYVIAGIYYPDNPAELAAAASPGVLPYADAFVVGNEGLQDGRYSLSVLTSAIAQVKQATGKPATTSEPGGQYYAGSPNSAALLALGDWLFPNIDYFLFPAPSTPQQMWTNVSFVYAYMLANQQTPGPVVAKEVFYPTAGGSALATEANQIGWYGGQAFPGTVNGKPFYFVWGEAFDQPWKQFTSYEPHMGLHGLNNAGGGANPKLIISSLQADYTGTYGAKSTRVDLKMTGGRPSRRRVLMSASVDARGPANPTGLVRFFDGSRYLGSAKVVRGIATLRRALSAGAHRLLAVFEGRGSYRWSRDFTNYRVVRRDA